MKPLTIKEIKEELKKLDEETDFIRQLRLDERKGVQAALKSWDKKQAENQNLIRAFQEKNQLEDSLYQKGYQLIAGIDEVGRGPLAGPVVCAAVILDPNRTILGLNDSKQLSLKKRQDLYERIMEEARGVGIAQASPEEIDQVNIYQATRLAMKRALDQLPISPDYLLVDDMTLDTNLPQASIVKGDAKSNSIAAASIVAKVTRDTLMADYNDLYPGYGFHKNVGYGTAEHLEGLQAEGLTPIHRKSFQPIKDMIENQK